MLLKLEAFGAYHLFEALSEYGSGCLIGALMLNNCSELSYEWRIHLTNKGIKICQTAPYTPKMNTIIDYLMWVLVEHASALLCDAQLVMAFWALTMSTANFLRNQSLIAAL